MLATDFNPGTSPIASLPVIIGLAVRRYGWSVREALLATTLNAAYVLGWSTELGSLEPGKRGDLVVLSENILEIDPTRIADVKVDLTVIGGVVVYEREVVAGR